ncbi:MAG: PorT family protein [Flavisolibacter sp.]|nr:PorT family protein [Flavisolibacter sp.]
MKKITLTTCFLLFISFCFAQTTTTKSSADKTVSLGIKAGVNIANWYNKSGNFVTTNNDARIGAYAGLFAHIHLGDLFAVQPEVVYSMQGFKNANNKYVANYINIPLLGQVMLGNGFRVETGPQLGILTDAKTEDYAGNENPGLKPFLKSTDFSWTFGASYLSPIGVGAEVRYNMGLSNIRTSTSDNVKNRVWQIGLFYQF